MLENYIEVDIGILKVLSGHFLNFLTSVLTAVFCFLVLEIKFTELRPHVTQRQCDCQVITYEPW